MRADEERPKRTIDYQTALTKACNYCARGERCQSQVSRKLYLWGAEPESWEALLQALVEDDYINELRYAKAYARDKLLLSGWGWRRIETELRRKGIDKDDIAEARAEIEDEEDYDVDETLLRLLESKWRTIPSSVERRKVWERLMRFGLYRGYEYSEVAEAIDTLLEES